MCGKRQQWKVLCVERGNSGKKQAAVARKKANMELRQQAVMLVAAIEEAEDVVAKNEGWHSLVRRRSNLEAAWASYEKAFYPHIRVADEEACAAASKSRCILRDSSDEALDLLETLIEAKAEEEASDVEVEDEICAAKAEVVVKWAANKVDVESCADKDAKELLCRGEADAGEAVEVVEEYADKVELGFCAAKDQLKLCAIKDELGKRRIGEVVVEECNSKMLLRSGDLDPGEGAGLGMEVKQSRLKVKQHLAGMVCGKFEVEEPRIAKDGLKFCATKDVEFEMQDVEFEVQRFVTAGCRAQGTNSEYG